MSARERAARAQKAKQEGAQAYYAGQSMRDRPYKKSPWGLGHWWEIGFQAAKRHADNSSGNGETDNAAEKRGTE